MRTWSVTSATVPTPAYSLSWRGTSTTRSSSPTSTVRVTFMPGKTTVSSSGTSSRSVTGYSHSKLELLSKFSLLSSESRRLESRLEMLVLLDAHNPAVAHVDDGGPAAEEIRAATLQRPLVGGIELDPGEPHNDNDAVSQPDCAFDDHVVVLGGAVRNHFEDALAADHHRVGLPGRHPRHVRIEHRRHRLEVPVDERVVAAEQDLGAFVAHGIESRRLPMLSTLGRPRGP